MLKYTRRYFQGIQPELHRYAQSTFHDGTHRQAPGDSTPWRDTSSPISRIRAWWLAPAAKGSVMAAWCMAIILGAYCVTLQQDAKRTYLLNSVILRNLHEETLRADANKERVDQFSRVIKHLYKIGKLKENTFKDLETSDISSSNSKSIDYETELCKERARSELVHERNQALVKELFNERQTNMKLSKENQRLAAELERRNRKS